MIDIGEKLSDIAFQHPAGSRVIFGNFIAVLLETAYGLVCSFSVPAGIRIADELPIKMGVYNSVHGVVE